MSMKRALSGLLMASAMMEWDGLRHKHEWPKPDPSAPIPKPIPAGCKEYFFDSTGYHNTEGMRKDVCVFYCVASNEKNAIRKYKKWKNQ